MACRYLGIMPVEPGVGTTSQSSVNGVGEVEISKAPKNAWEFLWFVTRAFGFPALMCAALAYYVVSRDEAQREMAAGAHQVFREALEAQTQAVRESTAEQRKMTEALIRLDSKLEEHLREDDKRKR